MKIFRVYPLNETAKAMVGPEQSKATKMDIKNIGNEATPSKEVGKELAKKNMKENRRVLDYENLPPHLHKIRESKAFFTWVETKGIQLDNAPSMLEEKKKFARKHDEDDFEPRETKKGRGGMREALERNRRLARLQEAIRIRRQHLDEGLGCTDCDEDEFGVEDRPSRYSRKDDDIRGGNTGMKASLRKFIKGEQDQEDENFEEEAHRPIRHMHREARLARMTKEARNEYLRLREKLHEARAMRAKLEERRARRAYDEDDE